MVITSHARLRLSQRGIHDAEISAVLQYGTAVHNGGALFYFMRRKDMPDSINPSARWRLEGITLVFDPQSETLITAYKNRFALRSIRRKRKEWVET